MSQLSLLYIYIYIERERVVGLTVQQTNKLSSYLIYTFFFQQTIKHNITYLYI